MSAFRFSPLDPPRARLGDTYTARLRTHTPHQGGSFATLDTGEDVFIAGDGASGLTEGAALTLRISAEARQGKLARGAPVNAAPGKTDPLTAWQQAFAGELTPSIDPPLQHFAAVNDAFNDADTETATISGGGVIRLSRTPALTAIDIDTAGRQDKGRASARALAVNTAAMSAAARALELRGLGGLVVLDCVSPTDRRTGPQIKAAFVTALRMLSHRKVEALAPSPFGLLEAALGWTRMPLADEAAWLSQAAPGWPDLLAGVRMAEHEAIANPSALLQLTLPKPALAAYLSRQADVDTALRAKYGGRIILAPGQRDTAEILHR